MIPFSGFMQAVNGSVPGLGNKTANIGKNVQGLPDNDDAILLSDDDARSFLEWVQKAMNNADTRGAEGEGGFNFQPDDIESDLPALDQLQALIADALGQSSADQAVPHPLDAESLGNGHVQLPQGIIAAIIAYQESRYSADNLTQEALVDVPEMMVANENTPGVGLIQPVADEKTFQTAVSGFPIQTGQGDERPIKENPLDGVMKENKPEVGSEKGESLFLLKPVAPDGDQAKSDPSRFIQERMPSDMETSEKSMGTTPPKSPIIAGQTKEAESMAAAFTDQKTASSKEDAADYQGKDRHNHTPRVEAVDVREDELQKSQSADSVKNVVVEQSKPHPSFQDTAKALSGDQSTNMAVKQHTGQPAASVGSEASASKAFQTTVMDQIIDKAAMRSIHGRSEIQIRLKPEFLGNVQMNIAADKEQLVVRIMTDRPMVKEIIETHLHHLKAELQNQGLTIDKFEVMVNPDANQQHSREQFAQMFKHHSPNDGRRQPHSRDPEALNQGGGNDSGDDPPDRDGVNYFA